MTSPNRRRGVRLLALVGLVLALLAGCGDDGTTATGASTTSAPSTTTTVAAGGTTSSTSQEHGCGVAEGGKVTITAKDTNWDVPCLQAPEGNPLTITVANQDKGLNHDLHITDLPGAPATPLFVGVAQQQLQLPKGLPAGTYHYVCDIHANMTGTLELLAPLAEGPTTTVPATAGKGSGY